jgi:hypothetical protein
MSKIYEECSTQEEIDLWLESVMKAAKIANRDRDIPPIFRERDLRDIWDSFEVWQKEEELDQFMLFANNLSDALRREANRHISPDELLNLSTQELYSLHNFAEDSKPKEKRDREMAEMMNSPWFSSEFEKFYKGRVLFRVEQEKEKRRIEDSFKNL